jgi:hypothetical protein
MDELTELIIGMGEDVLVDLPDMFSRGWSIPLDPSKREEVISACSDKKCRAIQNLINDIEDQQLEYEGNHKTSLAARIPGHDLGNIWVTVGISSLLVSMIDKNSYATQQSTEDNSIEKFLQHVTPYRAFCLAMAYLASDGDNRFTSELPVSQMQNFLRNKKYEFEFNPKEQDDNSIHSPEYVSFLQIVKNAPGKPVVRYEVNDGYGVLIVQDSGKGIKDRDGEPLSSERLGTIFAKFTSRKEGGLGLQVAKELVHLRGGHIVVETTTEGNPTISYDTSTRVVTEVAQRKVGTTFEIYTPTVSPQ